MKCHIISSFWAGDKLTLAGSRTFIPIKVDYEDVLKDPSPDHSLASLLEKAYGFSASLRVLAIRNIVAV
jgi:hypothetical protein